MSALWTWSWLRKCNHVKWSETADGYCVNKICQRGSNWTLDTNTSENKETRMEGQNRKYKRGLIITKGKRLKMTATQQWNCILCKITEWVQQMLSAQRSLTFCSQFLPPLKLHVTFRLAQKQYVESFMEWVSMSEQLYPNLKLSSAVQSLGWSDVKHATSMHLHELENWNLFL